MSLFFKPLYSDTLPESSLVDSMTSISSSRIPPEVDSVAQMSTIPALSAKVRVDGTEIVPAVKGMEMNLNELVDQPSTYSHCL